MEVSIWVIVAIGLVAFPIAFGALWSFVGVLLATLSGWGAMAMRYPCPEGLRGTALRTGFANSVGGVGYKGVLTFEETDRALLVRVLRLFPFHPALAIPWSALQQGPTGGSFSSGCLEVTGGGRFSLNREANDSLTAALARHGANARA